MNDYETALLWELRKDSKVVYAVGSAGTVSGHRRQSVSQSGGVQACQPMAL